MIEVYTVSIDRSAELLKLKSEEEEVDSDKEKSSKAGPSLHLDLLKLFSEEEKYWLKEHHSRATYYTGLMTTITGAVLFGFFNAKTDIHYASVAVASAIMYFLARAAPEAMHRMYCRYLEAITMRAKMEQIMGLHQLAARDATFWPGEGLIPRRYIVARETHKDSMEFVTKNSHLGYQRITERVFAVFSAASIIAFLGALGLLASAHPPPILFRTLFPLTAS